MRVSKFEGSMNISKFIWPVLAIIFNSCDTPRDRRPTPVGNGNSYGYFNPYSSPTTTSGNNTTGTRTGDTTGTGASASATPTPGAATAPVTIPSEIAHCSWSKDGQSGFQSYHQHLGSYTLCKSKTSPMDIYIQLQTPSSDAQICIIPTTNSGGNSTYIGEPRCLMVDSNSKVYKVTLYKNRPGYTSYNFTGVMAMKDKSYYYPYPFKQYILSPDAYMYCANWLEDTGDSSFCESFNSVGQYVYQTF